MNAALGAGLEGPPAKAAERATTPEVAVERRSERGYRDFSTRLRRWGAMSGSAPAKPPSTIFASSAKSAPSQYSKLSRSKPSQDLKACRALVRKRQVRLSGRISARLRLCEIWGMHGDAVSVKQNKPSKLSLKIRAIGVLWHCFVPSTRLIQTSCASLEQ